MDAMPRVSIIILNWNGWKDTIECLESVYQITYPNYDVIVVDNGSDNESVEKIKEYAEGKSPIISNFFEYSKQNMLADITKCLQEEIKGKRRTEKSKSWVSSTKNLILIKNDINCGFAEGSNIGIQWAIERGYDYILLLNNDTTVEPNILSSLLHAAEINPNAGMVGPKIIDYYSHKMQFAGGSIAKRNLLNPFVADGFGKDDQSQFDRIKKCEWLTGCCLLIPVDVLLDIGLFDTSFFAYCEDVDLSLRVSKMGYDIIYCPDTRVWHKGGASSGGPMSPLAFYLSTRNKLYVIWDYFPFPEKYLQLLFLYTLYPVGVFVYCLIVKNNFSLLKALGYALIYPLLLGKQREHLDNCLRK